MTTTPAQPGFTITGLTVNVHDPITYIDEYGMTRDLRAYVTGYTDGNTAVMLTDVDGEAWGPVSVNIPDAMRYDVNSIWLNHNVSDEERDALVKAGLIERGVAAVRQGYVTFVEYRLTGNLAAAAIALRAALGVA